MKKRIAAVLAACVLIVGLTACKRAGGSSDMASGTVSGAVSSTAEKVSISMLNSKGEIQSQLEEAARIYQQETGVTLDVIACGTGETPYTKITSMYNAGTAPTLAMLDPTDIVALAAEKAVDLSDEKWTAECAESLLRVDGKVYAMPLCVEGRGLIYNRAAIEKTLGTEFDPSAIQSYDALKTLLESLRAHGMEYPVVISKEDWSVGAHLFGLIYDTYDGTTAGSERLINELKAGSVRMENVTRYDEWRRTFDLLLQYNINHADPLGALYEQDPIHLADGDAALWFNGNWAWPNLQEADADPSDGYGFLPYVMNNNPSDFANTQIQASPSKCILIDRVQATDGQIAAAKAFLNWLVYNETGQRLLVEKCGLIPACTNNPFSATDPLSADIQQKIKNGGTFGSSFIAPGDHWRVVGAQVQKYMAGQQTGAQLAAAVDAYWQGQK